MIKSGPAAMIGGIAYLIVFILGIFANFFVFDKLVIPGDANATISNIFANDTLFRLGLSSWFIVIICDLLVAWALFIFLSPVNKDLALLAAWFRIVFVAIFTFSFTPYLSMLQISSSDFSNTSGFDKQFMATLLLKEHDFGTQIGFVFFGLHVIVIGYLIMKSGYVPGILGLMLLIAGAGYLINSFGNFLSQAYAENKIAFFVTVAIPAMLSELSLTIWLLVRGRKI